MSGESASAMKLCGTALIPGSPELHSIEQVHFCCFGSAHNVAHGHQRAGVQLAGTLLGGVQHGDEEHGELVGGGSRGVTEREKRCGAWSRYLRGTCLRLQVPMAPRAAMLRRSVSRRLLSSSIDISTATPPS